MSFLDTVPASLSEITSDRLVEVMRGEPECMVVTRREGDGVRMMHMHSGGADCPLDEFPDLRASLSLKRPSEDA